MIKENWKDVKGYENYYQVSDLGNVKSLPKIVIRNGIRGKTQKRQGVLLKPGIYNGYKKVVLCDNKNRKSRYVHQLVAESFLNHTANGHSKVVDHIDNNSLNNNVNNLQIITQRMNTTKNKVGGTSIYAGVSWNKNRCKWEARAHNGEIYKFLGYYNNEIDAKIAYKNYIASLP